MKLQIPATLLAPVALALPLHAGEETEVGPPPAVPAESALGSIRIEGTEATIDIGGRIKLDAIKDFDAIGTTDEFKTATIPVPKDSTGGNARFHARDTRLHLEARSPSELGDLRAYVEGNFFGDGNDFTLRHAYVESEDFLVGHTWTTFMLIEARPETLDFEGPAGEVFLRQGQARWVRPFEGGSRLQMALEDPSSDVTAPANSTAEQELPDFTIGYLQPLSGGSLYYSGVVRQIGYDGASSDKVLGLGGAVSGRFDVGDRDDVRFQVAYGLGIARYIADLRGSGLDAGQDSGGDLEALPTYGGYAAYRHHWNDELRSNAVLSLTGVDNSSGQPATALERTTYGALNLIWSAAKHFDVGVEYLYGRRENNDGDDATANRLQFSCMYSF